MGWDGWNGLGVKGEQMGGESMQVGDGRGGWRKERKRMCHRSLDFGLGQRRWAWIERNGLGRCNRRNRQWLSVVSLPNTFQCFGPHFLHKYPIDARSISKENRLKYLSIQI